MSEHPPTLLIVYLRPEHDEEACYHIDEALTTAGITIHYHSAREKTSSILLSFGILSAIHSQKTSRMTPFFAHFGLTTRICASYDEVSL
jgi:hypothetical protein